MISTTPHFIDLPSVSASQIGSFNLGARRWWLEYACRNKSPQSSEMRLGEWGHSATEARLKSGAVIKTELEGINTDITWESLQLLWADPLFPDGLCAAVEEPKNYKLGLTVEGVPVKGKIDYRSWAANPHQLVLDWKSSSNIRYAKSPEALARDPQIIIYGAYALSQGAEIVTAGHGYFQTKREPAHRIVFTDPMDREHIEAVYNGPLAEVVRDMKAVASSAAAMAGDPLSIPCHERGNPSKKNCMAFKRPCPFMSLCGVGEFEAAEDAEDFTSLPITGATTSTMSLKDALNKAQPTSATPAPAAPPKVRATGINPPDGLPPEVPAQKYVPKPQTIEERLALSPNQSIEALQNIVDEAVGPALLTKIKGQTSPPGLYLYIDCIPTKGVSDYLRLEDEIERRAAPIAAKAGVTDVREIGFGAGTAELFASFKKDPPKGVVVAVSSGLSNYVTDVLLPIATVVVRGVR